MNPLAILGKYKMVLAAVGLAIVGVVAAVLVLGGSAGTPITQNTAGNEPSRAEKEMLDQLLELRSIQLSGALFTNPLFLSLVDFSQSIEEQPVGRTNPFAPVSVEVGRSTSTPVR